MILHFLMLRYFDTALFDFAYLMLVVPMFHIVRKRGGEAYPRPPIPSLSSLVARLYFNFVLVFAALLSVAVCHYFTIQRRNILRLHYSFHIVLLNATLDECCTFSICSIDILC